MKTIDITNILLNENAYFFKKKKRIVAKYISDLFKECKDDKGVRGTYKPIIRESLFESGLEIAKFSVLIFEYTQKPSFLKEPADLWENKTGLFVILEHGDYLAVLRKNVSGIYSLKQIAEEIDYSILANFMASATSRFEKIISNNLNTAENAIQIKTSEGIDLKGIMNRFGISKQIISSLRLDNEGEKSSISLGTSRVNSLNIRSDFESVLFWMVKIIKLIDGAYRAPRINSFLSGFAKPVDFEREIRTLVPKFLLLRFHSIKDDLDSGFVSECYSLDDNGNHCPENLLDVIADNSKIFELTRYDSKTYKCGNTSIRINKKTISFSDSILDTIFLSFDGSDSITLSDYINRKNHFLITFNQPEFAYTHWKMFKDHKLLEDIDVFMDAFIGDPLLAAVTSEKGVGYTQASDSFTPDSMFGYIEHKLIAQVDCLISDDMGAEWGDYISIRQDEICFYHLKYNNLGLSASNLEEVFGQAQKNFGFLELTNEMVDYRAARWSSNYHLPAISRIRKRVNNGQSAIDSVRESINKASLSSNIQRKVYVVINFLSKAQLKDALDQVKNGQTFHHRGVTMQILWFVNSLLSSANELNVQFKIICRP